MANIDELIAAMDDKADRLEDLGYRVRFDLKNEGSILLDARDGNVDITEDEPARRKPIRC